MYNSWGYGYYKEDQLSNLLLQQRYHLRRPDGTFGIIICKETVLDDDSKVDTVFEDDQGLHIHTPSKWRSIFDRTGYDVFY